MRDINLFICIILFVILNDIYEASYAYYGIQLYMCTHFYLVYLVLTYTFLYCLTVVRKYICTKVNIICTSGTRVPSVDAF